MRARDLPKILKSAYTECTIVMSLAVVLYDYGMYRMTPPMSIAIELNSGEVLTFDDEVLRF